MSYLVSFFVIFLLLSVILVSIETNTSEIHASRAVPPLLPQCFVLYRSIFVRSCQNRLNFIHLKTINTLLKWEAYNNSIWWISKSSLKLPLLLLLFLLSTKMLLLLIHQVTLSFRLLGGKFLWINFEKKNVCVTITSQYTFADVLTFGLCCRFPIS